ncbi:hypothetical protein J437_LFUL002156 [Ladona fulva]|uniref:Regulatory protein zeste n=1 Tax=Ladona fulva TaxID=123851 RepID=A0A8K0JXQ2_LADFU|nr:hypothetical protein J437_LFUL002156 [Ladona fulva]
MATRNAAFTLVEKRILIDLVEKFKKVLENKKTDAANCEQKRKKWNQVTKEFNSHGNITRRDAEQLKRCWEKMKCMLKKEKMMEVRARMGTGGGPFIAHESDPLCAQIETIVPFINEEVGRVLDSDYHHLNPNSASPTSSSKSIDSLSPSRTFYVSAMEVGPVCSSPVLAGLSAKDPSPKRVPIISTPPLHQEIPGPSGKQSNPRRKDLNKNFTRHAIPPPLFGGISNPDADVEINQ